MIITLNLYICSCFYADFIIINKITDVTFNYLSRSNYKKHLLMLDDLYFFYSIVNPEFEYKLSSRRNKTVNNLSIRNTFYVHQGNSIKDVRLSEYSIGRKVGEFSKTRRPFFLDLKKKDKFIRI